MVTRFFRTPKMSCYLNENHRASPTLILLYVLGVLNVLHVLYVLHLLHVLHVLHGRIVGLLGLVIILVNEFEQIMTRRPVLLGRDPIGDNAH